VLAWFAEEPMLRVGAARPHANLGYAGQSDPSRIFAESYPSRRISMETLNRTARAAP